jgi:hypothetical protein
MANGHNVQTLECPNLDAFVAASPGALICRLSKLPVLVFSEEGQLLIVQAIASLTSTVGGFALRGGTPTVAPWLFLDCYLEVPPPLLSDSLFAMVLPSHVTSILPVQGGGPPAPAPVHHGGPPSCPNPVGINVALPAHPAASLRFGGHGLHYSQRPQYVHSSPASRGGYIPYNSGRFFRTAPPNNFGYYHHGHGSPPAHHGGHPSAQLCPSVHGGRHAPPRDVPLFVYGGALFLQGHWGYPCVATLVAPSLAFAGLSHNPSLPQEDHRSTSDLTLPCHFPALVEAYLLLSRTLPMPLGLFHLPPHPVLLPPLLLWQRCSSLTPSRM